MRRFGWLAREKLGLTAPADNSDRDSSDKQLAADWLELLERHSVDFTLGWRRLADAAEGHTDALEALFPSAVEVRPWLGQWRCRLAGAPNRVTAAAMRAVNPIYIPRNHLVEEALTAASDHGDLTPFEQLLDVITKPYEERSGLENYAQPAPSEFTVCYKTFCGT